MSHVQLTNVNKTFGIDTVNENHVLKDLNLTLNSGDFVTVIGGNGAGKSTTLNAIAGAFPVDTGTITIADQDVTNWSATKRAQLIGHVFQDPRMGTATRLTIEENMAVANRRGLSRGLRRGVSAQDRTLIKERLATLGLGLEDRLTMEVGFLSGGQRQALTLLMATLRRPDLLLLDEHTAALDPKTSEMVLSLTDDIVRQEKLTTLMITHNMEDALKYGNRIIMLHQGRIMLDLAGEAKKDLTVPALLELFKQQSGESITSDAMLLG